MYDVSEGLATDRDCGCLLVDPFYTLKIRERILLTPLLFVLLFISFYILHFILVGVPVWNPY